MTDQARLWMRRVAEAAALTAIASTVALTLTWLFGDWPPHLSELVLPPAAIFLTLLATSASRERRRRERRRRASETPPPEKP